MTLSWWQRCKVWLAKRLTRGTPTVVVRLAPSLLLLREAGELQQYVERSGALSDPRRLKAYRRILRSTTRMEAYGQDVIIDWQRRLGEVQIVPLPGAAHGEGREEETAA